MKSVDSIVIRLITRWLLHTGDFLSVPISYEDIKNIFSFIEYKKAQQITTSFYFKEYL